MGTLGGKGLGKIQSTNHSIICSQNTATNDTEKFQHILLCVKTFSSMAVYLSSITL